MWDVIVNTHINQRVFVVFTLEKKLYIIISNEYNLSYFLKSAQGHALKMSTLENFSGTEQSIREQPYPTKAELILGIPLLQLE